MTAVRRPPPSAAVAIVVAVMAAAGCSRPVPVPVAPYAADPDCATVVLALPDGLAGLPRLETGSQATVAWGDRTAPVVLRCGVEPPPPTTDPCVTIADATASVDWLATPTGEGAEGRWTFTTYGREPAVEVVLPSSGQDAATVGQEVLLALGPAVARVPADRACR